MAVLQDKFIENLKFNSSGLIPAIAQSESTGEILMLAWMNEESIKESLKTGFVHYYSRSRKALWKKGGTSGNTQKLQKFRYDCDADCILLTVQQEGPACHTGRPNCFFNEVDLTTGDVTVISKPM